MACELKTHFLVPDVDGKTNQASKKDLTRRCVNDINNNDGKDNNRNNENNKYDSNNHVHSKKKNNLYVSFFYKNILPRLKALKVTQVATSKLTAIFLNSKQI